MRLLVLRSLIGVFFAVYGLEGEFTIWKRTGPNMGSCQAWWG